MAELLVAGLGGLRRLVALAGLVAGLGLSVVGAACSSPTDPTPRPPTPGSFRLTGIITDAASAVPMQGAIVEARIAADESMPIATIAAGPDGQYSLSGVRGLSYVRVRQYGYFDVNERVELTADGARNFSIARDPSVPDLNGAYTLTIEADAACPAAPNPLPPNLRRRTFPAQMQQVGQSLTVLVDPPCYGLEGACTIRGSASTNGATFRIADSDYSSGWYDRYPDLVEILGPGYVEGLWFLGVATTNLSATGLSGSLAGTITYHPSLRVPMGPSTAGCGAGRFELSRR